MKISRDVVEFLKTQFVGRHGKYTIDDHLTPAVTESVNLGSDSLRWNVVYAKDINAEFLTGEYDADSVDGFHAYSTPTASSLLALDTGSKFPVAAIPQGHGSTLNADQVDGYEGSELAVLAESESITGQWQFSPASAQAPFTLNANAQGQTVTGFRADELNKSISPGTGMTGGGVLTEDRTLAVDTTYAFTWTGLHTFNAGLTVGVGQNLNFGADVTFTRIGENKVSLVSGDALETNYTSGWSGSGYHFDYNQSFSNQSFLEIDRLSVRGIMNVYELLIHQIRATNGSIFVSNTGKAKAITDNGGGSYTITTETDHGFDEDDLIRAQRFTGTGVYQCDMTVTSVADTTHFTATLRATYDAPAVGMEFVRIGNTTDTDRQGSIYLTADDTGAPYINVLAGVASFADWGTTTKTKVRLGNLNGAFGISSNLYGIGMGDYADDNFLRYDTSNGLLLSTGGGSHLLDDTGLSIFHSTGVYLYKFFDDASGTNRVSHDYLWFPSGGVTRTIEMMGGTAYPSHATLHLLVSTSTEDSFITLSTNGIYTDAPKVWIQTSPLYVGALSLPEGSDGDIVMSGNLLRNATGTQTIGEDGASWDDIYVTNLHSVNIEGDTIGGQTWHFDGSSMNVEPHSATGHTIVYIANPDTTYMADLDVERNITLGGTIDGVDLATHASNQDAHHSKVHTIDGSDHSNWSTYFDQAVKTTSSPTFGGLRVDGNVGIWKTGSYALDVQKGNICIGSDHYDQTSRTDSTNKSAHILLPHYSTSEEPVLALRSLMTSNANTISFGGGYSNGNAATQIEFFTASNYNTLTGTKRMVIDKNGYVGINVDPPSGMFHIAGVNNQYVLYATSTRTETSGWNYHGYFKLYTTPSVAGNFTSRGFGVENHFNGSAASTGTTMGGYFSAGNEASVSLSAAVGVQGSIFVNNASASISNGYSLMAGSPWVNAGTIGNMYGIYISQQKMSGVTSGYGVYQVYANDINFFSGKVGIGNNNPASWLEINKSDNPNGSTNTYGVSLWHTIDPTTTDTATHYGGLFQNGVSSGSVENISYVRALMGMAFHQGTGTVSNLFAVLGQVQLYNAGGSVSTAHAFYALPPSRSSGDKTITTAYGLFIDGQKTAFVTNGWGIYQYGANDENFFAGDTYFGTPATPAVCIDVAQKRLGVATNTPAYNLEVIGNGRISSNFNIDGALDVDGATVLHDDLTIGSNLFFFDYSQENLGIGTAPDSQFLLDVAGPIRGTHLVGKHAIQLDSMLMLLHFDGSQPFHTNFSGTLMGHMGQMPSTVAGGVIFRPGKFGTKAVQIGQATVNKITNPRAGAGNTTGWNPFTNVTLDPVTDQEGNIVGETAFKATITGDITSNAASTPLSNPTLTQGTPFSAQIRVRGVGSTIGKSFGLLLWESGGSQASQNVASTSTTLSKDWKYITCTGTLNQSDRTAVTLYVQLFGDAVDDVFYWTDVQAEEYPYSTHYADGSLGVGYSWSGTAHQSSSIRSRSYVDYPLGQYVETWIDRGTLGFWVIPGQDWTSATSGTGDWSDILKMMTETTTQYGIRVEHYTDDRISLWMYGNSGQGVAYQHTMYKNTAYFVLFTWDRDGLPDEGTSDTARIYVDGVKVANTTAFAGYLRDSSTPVLTLGFNANDTNGSALIDDLFFMERGMDADEIRAVFESDAQVFVETSTFSWRAPGKAPVWVDEEGLWMRDLNGYTVLGAYGGTPDGDDSDTKSWGGATLGIGDILIGDLTNGGGWLWDASAHAISLRDSSAERIGLTAAGVLTIKNSAGNAVFTFDASDGAEFTLPLTLGTGGGIYQGSGTFGSPTTGLKIWRDGSGTGRIAGYNSGVLQAGFGTDGRFSAGGGLAVIDELGYRLTGEIAAVSFESGSTEIGRISYYLGDSTPTIVMQSGMSSSQKISNTGFESGLTGWTTSVHGAVIQQASGGHSGSYSMEFLCGGDYVDPDYGFATTTDYMTTSGGESVHVTLWSKVPYSSYDYGYSILYVMFYDSGSSLLRTDSQIIAWYENYTTWRQCSLITPASPSNAVKFKVQIFATAGGGSSNEGFDIFVDDVFAYSVASQAYFKLAEHSEMQMDDFTLLGKLIVKSDIFLSDAGANERVFKAYNSAAGFYWGISSSGSIFLARTNSSGTWQETPLIYSSPYNTFDFASKNITTTGSGSFSTSNSGWFPFTAYQVLPGSGITDTKTVFEGTVDRSMTVRTWSQLAYVSSTNNGSNYWNINLKNLYTGVIIKTLNTSSGSPDTWLLLESGAIGTAITTAAKGLIIQAIVGAGTPGTLYLGGPAVYVK